MSADWRFMHELQRKILEALDQHKTDRNPPNLNPIWIESDVAPGVFMHAWRTLVDNGYVKGWGVTNQSNETIVGAGQITSTGEEALSELDQTTASTEPEIEDLLTDIVRLQRQVSDLTAVAEQLFALVSNTQRFTEQQETAFKKIPKLLEHVRHPEV
jgi:hypothetical protein